jgi:hypothetical protein
MAIDTGAIAQMHNLKAQKKELSSQKLQKAMKEGFEKIDASNKKVTATEAIGLDNYLKTLSYASTDEDIAKAHELNQNWLTNANDREMYARDKTLNQAIYDSKEQMINMVSDRQDEYSTLNSNIGGLEEQLQTLQTADNEQYDFTEINEVLKNYKQAGENIIKYNQNWVGKSEYKANIAEVKNWVKTGKVLKGMDQDPYSAKQIDAQYETKTEILSPEIEGYSLSHLLNEDDFDASNAKQNVDSFFDGGALDSNVYSEFLPEGFTLNEEQVVLKEKADSAAMEALEFYSKSSNEGWNFADGEEEINGMPNGEYYGATEQLHGLYNTAQEATNNFLNSVQQEHVPAKIREYEELVSDAQLIESGTEGIQLHEDYKDQPYFQTLIDRAYDQWKLGDEVGANSTMGLATKYMIEGIRNQDAAEQEVTKNRNEFLHETVIPNLSETRLDAIEEFANKISMDPKLAESPPSSMSEDDALIAERMAIGGEYFPDIHNAFSVKKNAIFDKKAEVQEQSVYQMLEDLDNYFIGDNIGDLVDKTEKVKTYTIGKETLTNPKVRTQVSEAIVSNMEDFFSELSDSDITGMSDMKKIMDGTYKDGSKEWYMAMDRVVEKYLPKDDRGVRNKGDVDWIAKHFWGDGTWNVNTADALEKSKMEGLMKLLEGFAMIRDFDSFMGEDPADELGIFNNKKD